LIRNLKLPYGNLVQRVGIPSRNIVSIAEPRHVQTVDNEEAEIARAIDNPIGTPPISEIASPDENILIIVDDHKRPLTPTSKILPILLDRLKKIGVKGENIRILVATGAHEKPLWEDVKQKVGEEVAGKFRISIHDCLDKENLTLLGISLRGTPVWVNQEVARADLKIGVGSIVPHPWAGYGGGGKIIMPGVSSWEAIGRNHTLALSTKARIGNIIDNPFRRDIEDVARTVGLDMIVNAVPNDQGKMVRVIAGDLVEAHRKGAEISRKIFENHVEGVADVLVMAFGPKDETLWQVIGSARTLVMMEQLVKKWGTVILVASCREGLYRFAKGVHHLNCGGNCLGHDDLLELLRSGTRPEKFLSETLKGHLAYPELGVKGYLISKMAATRNIILASDKLSEKEIDWLGTTAETAEEALNEAIQTQGCDASVMVIPYMAQSLAFFKKSHARLKKDSL
jgi:nickel-dependent lactate racemase